MHHEAFFLLKEKYDGIQTPAFFADLKRLQHGEPLAYLIGHTPFLSATIYLDSHPLIPRPETEYWTEHVIAAMKKISSSKEKLSVLDLCAGSGCIGIAILLEIPTAYVDFAERIEAHHSTIEKNILVNAIAHDRTRIFGGSLFTEISDSYDFIVCNPPYIDPRLDRTEHSVRTFEPHEALYGGTDGMACINEIMCEAKHYLQPGGQLYIEHEPEQGAAMLEHARAHGYSINTYTDQYNTPRYSVLAMAQ